MIYVGKDLKSLSGITEPCLINPTLSIAAQGSVREREFGYWPSFSEISPRARRAYLNWLADGRRDPEADIGYVFLFFYGLERSATVSNGIGWDNQVAEARRQRTEAEELMRSAAPVYSRTPQASQSPLSADTKAQCSALNERVAMLDSMGRAGSRYYDLDWVRSERKKARDEQYRLRC